jgi:hypothetical protein
MRFDEAPAATCRGSTGKRIVTAGKSTDFLERSDQPRCCGNPSWTKPAGIHGGLAALQHSSCVPAFRFDKAIKKQKVAGRD